MIQIIFPDGRHAEYTTLGAMSMLVESFFAHARDCLYYFAEEVGVGENGEPVARLDRMKFAVGKPEEVTSFLASGHEATLLNLFHSQLLHAASGDRIKLAAMLRAGIWSDEDLSAGLRTHSAEQLALFMEVAQKRHLGLHFFIQSAH